MMLHMKLLPEPLALKRSSVLPISNVGKAVYLAASQWKLKSEAFAIKPLRLSREVGDGCLPF